jgi:hypothetical protein
MRVIQHPAYEAPRRRLRRALDEHRPGHMVFIIGPSGVGKTTMRRSVMQEMFGNPACWGCGRVPVVETFAMLPRGAFFSSRELARSLLDELNAPSLRWLLEDSQMDPAEKQAIRLELEGSSELWRNVRNKVATEGEYWRMVQQCLLGRGCKYVSIDQVTALLVNHRDTTPASHTLHLMSLAESTGAMFVMTGVHDAVRLWDIHSELRRRVITIWVPPYSDKRSQDRVPFLRLLRSLGAKHQLSRDDLLVRMPHDILAATGGVFDEIVKLLRRASSIASEAGCIKIQKRHIESAYYSESDLAALWRDIEAFENAMRAGDVSRRAALARSRWERVSEPTLPSK